MGGLATPIETTSYLHPLTLEAQMFLTSMECYGQSCNRVDANMIDVLEKIVTSIDTFLKKNLSPVVATEKTKLIAPNEINTVVRYYHCSVCKRDLGKGAEKAVVHLVEHKQKKQKKAKGKSEKIVKLPKKVVSLISSDILKCCAENILIAENLKHKPEYDVIENELLDLIKPLFPETSVKVYKFGSRLIGTGSQHSDLDLYVDIANTFNIFENRASPQTLNNLALVRDILKKNQKAWTQLVAVESARVPILKVRNKTTNIDCDIGFSNSLGFFNTRLLEYLFELQPIARYMCIYIKKWVERSKTTDRFSSYSVSLMIVFLLQIKQYLPPISQLQGDVETLERVGPWIAGFVHKTIEDLKMQRVDINAENCLIFIKLFFEFYSHFNFEVNAVCPYHGRIIKLATLEQEMPERYTTYAQNGTEHCLEIKKCIVVQDPIQLNHNVTKSVYPLALRTVISYFKQSLELLELR